MSVEMYMDEDGDIDYIDEPFYTTETPETGWALVSKDALFDSQNQDYIQQTLRLIDHLKNTVFNAKPLPIEYQTAVDQFEAYLQKEFPNKDEAEINMALRGLNYVRYVKELAIQPITTLIRHTVSEAFYDAMLIRVATGTDFLLSDISTWTSSRSSDGNFVSTGFVCAAGTELKTWDLDDGDFNLGVLFSRKGPPSRRHALGVSRPLDA